MSFYAFECVFMFILVFPDVALKKYILSSVLCSLSLFFFWARRNVDVLCLVLFWFRSFFCVIIVGFWCVPISAEGQDVRRCVHIVTADTPWRHAGMFWLVVPCIVH